MSSRIATIVSGLLVAGIGAGIVLYRDVGALRENVEQLQRDIDARDLRERRLTEGLVRVEERVSAAVAAVATRCKASK